METQDAASLNNETSALGQQTSQDKAQVDKPAASVPDEMLCFNLIKEGDDFRTRWDYDEALKKYNAAIEINPVYFKPYFKKGLIYYLQNNLEAAEEEWKKAWKLEWQK